MNVSTTFRLEMILQKTRFVAVKTQKRWHDNIHQ